jgi:hypothetical protein
VWASMARKPPSIQARSLRRKGPTEEAVASLLMEADSVGRRMGRNRDISALIERRAALAALLIRFADLLDYIELSPGHHAPRSNLRTKAELRGREDQTVQTLTAIDRRIVRMPSRTLRDAVLKLNLCAAMQRYEPTTNRPSRILPIELQMLFSGIADLKRLGRV